MNLFVARLNPSTTNKDLHQLFSHYGLVTKVRIVFDQITCRSKNYGFVEMPNLDEAEEAIKELDKASFQDKMITVKVSQNTDYQNATEESEFANRNTTHSPKRNGENQEYNHISASLNKTQRSVNDRRNFGYRGNGYERF